MKSIERIVLQVALLLTVFTARAQDTNSFQEIYDLVENTNYFSAKELFDLNKSKLTNLQQLYVEATLNNAFNRLEESEKAIDEIVSRPEIVADSLLYKLYEIRCDNAIKLYKYKEAKEAIKKILSDYQQFLTEKEELDFENSLKIWSALENVKPQTVEIAGRTELQLEKDKAGLKNLKVSHGKKSFNFIFDTGANLSLTTMDVAKELKMKLIPVEIDVMTITGTSVKAELAVCELLKIGNITIQHAVFLVLPENSLSFKEIDYQIYGIIGFPIMQALKEIQLTKDGRFIVPEKRTHFNGHSNMAMNGLTPLISINNMHFTFDTGANTTLFYARYFEENKEEIEKNYALETISMGGANGMASFEGYKIHYEFDLEGTMVELNEVEVLTAKIKDNEKSYGNIGQDVIQQFDSMTLNFDRMFIRFENND